MPFDGTDPGLNTDYRFAKLADVGRLLATEQQWCKGRLRDSEGRHCLDGAMQAVEARQILEPIIMRAAREVGGKHYWRLEFFNDDPVTTHADILRVLRRARENIIAEMIEGDYTRSFGQRLAQALRAFRSGSLGGAWAALRLEASETRTPAVELPSTPIRQNASAAYELCDVS